MVFPGFVISMRGASDEWIEVFGLDAFSIDSTIAVGHTSTSPLVPVILLGDLNSTKISDSLLTLGYELSVTGGTEYYGIRGDFKARLDSPEGRLALSLMNRAVVTDDLIVASPETRSIEEFLNLMDGSEEAVGDNMLALSTLEALGETYAATLMTRSAIFNPNEDKPVTFDKLVEWADLDEWEIFAAGGGMEDGQPFFAMALGFNDPDAAGRNAGELKARVSSYRTLLGDRYPESHALLEAWPSEPFREGCDSISVDSHRWSFGSAINLRCKSDTKFPWSLLIDLRDVGFLFP